MTATSRVNQPHHRRWRRGLIVVRRLMVALVISVTVAAVALAVLVRHSADGIDTILGHPVFSVASGSMTPAIDTGDLIVDEPLTAAQAADLHVGQVITFRESTSSSLIVTHRIAAVLRGPITSSVSYRTKGDANNSPDLVAVASGEVLGVYQMRVPFGAYVLSTLHQPLTFAILVMVPVTYLAEEEIRRRWTAIGENESRRRRAIPGGAPERE